ncbi:hypothetical protein LZ023_13175 [Pseudomonas silvicola]|nr:hypothetical protein LZ023_13165 [Pseudomonas silvicola]WAH60408.1 hypothetical protein LZ023_13175 [Pseudomonas silvicola]
MKSLMFHQRFDGADFESIWIVWQALFENIFQIHAFSAIRARPSLRGECRPRANRAQTKTPLSERRS